MRIIPGHLVSMSAWSEWVDYENYIFEDDRKVNSYDVYRDTPGKDECDELSARLSGEVIIYNIKQTRS